MNTNTLTATLLLASFFATFSVQAELWYPQDVNPDACKGGAKNAIHMQEWLTAGSGNPGKPLGLKAGTCKFSEPLVLLNAMNLSITGVSKGMSVLEYTGERTTTDIISLGHPRIPIVLPCKTTEYPGCTTPQDIQYGCGIKSKDDTTLSPWSNQLNLKGFSINSSATMEEGTTALHFNCIQYSEIDIGIGYPGGTILYGGLWLDGMSFINLNSSEFYTSGFGVRANDGVELRMGNSIIQGKGDGNGIHIGGNFGGLLTESVDEIGYNVGLQIDTTLTQTTVYTRAVGNTQIFVGPSSVFDSNSNAGCYFNDQGVPILDEKGNSISGVKFAMIDGWFATTTMAGSACTILNWHTPIPDSPTSNSDVVNGFFTSSAGKFYNSKENGLYFGDPYVSPKPASLPIQILLGSGAIATGNVGEDVFCYSPPVKYANGMLPFNGSVTAQGCGTNLATKASTF